MGNKSRCGLIAAIFSSALFVCTTAHASGSYDGRHSGWHGGGQSHGPSGNTGSSNGAGVQVQSNGAFQGHNVSQFDEHDRERWISGRWHHGWHNNHIGWWWFTGGLWYFYSEPIYPYPGYVSSEVAEDDYDNGDEGAPPSTWYYCKKAKAFYPYVRTCDGQWERVPMTPPDLQDEPDSSNQSPPPDDDGYHGLQPPGNGDLPPPPPSND